MRPLALRGSGKALRFSEHLEGDGEAIFRHACALGLEGIVSKRRDARYRSGRSQSEASCQAASHGALRRLYSASQTNAARSTRPTPDRSIA